MKIDYTGLNIKLSNYLQNDSVDKNSTSICTYLYLLTICNIDYPFSIYTNIDISDQPYEYEFDLDWPSPKIHKIDNIQFCLS